LFPEFSSKRICHNLMKSIILESVSQSHRMLTHQFKTKFQKKSIEISSISLFIFFLTKSVYSYTYSHFLYALKPQNWKWETSKDINFQFFIFFIIIISVSLYKIFLLFVSKAVWLSTQTALQFIFFLFFEFWSLNEYIKAFSLIFYIFSYGRILS
jgi:hypothetical protein